MRNPSHGGYWVGGRSRPNKTARGMTLTRERSQLACTPIEELSKDVLALLVRGTTAKMGRSYGWHTEFVEYVCPCCGQPVKKLRLNDKGRRALATLQARAQARVRVGQTPHPTTHTVGA